MGTPGCWVIGVAVRLVAVADSAVSSLSALGWYAHDDVCAADRAFTPLGRSLARVHLIPGRR